MQLLATAARKPPNVKESSVEEESASPRTTGTRESCTYPRAPGTRGEACSTDKAREPGKSSAVFTAGISPSALKIAKKIGLSDDGSAIASAMRRLSNESGETSKDPGEKAATYTLNPIHVAAIAARAGRVVSAVSPPSAAADIAIV